MKRKRAWLLTRNIGLLVLRTLQLAVIVTGLIIMISKF